MSNRELRRIGDERRPYDAKERDEQLVREEERGGQGV
jgi:hypothetical protein